MMTELSTYTGYAGSCSDEKASISDAAVQVSFKGGRGMVDSRLPRDDRVVIVTPGVLHPADTRFRHRKAFVTPLDFFSALIVKMHA